MSGSLHFKISFPFIANLTSLAGKSTEMQKCVHLRWKFIVGLSSEAIQIKNGNIIESVDMFYEQSVKNCFI